MMTLRELMDKVDDASSIGRVPPVSQIIETGSPVVAAEKMRNDTDITIYQNGYVLYRKESRATVFPLHRCREYVEKSVTEKDFEVPFEVFADQPWQIRVVIEGEKRIIHNINALQNYFKHCSYNAFLEEGSVLSDEGKGDPLRILIEEEARNEENEELYSILDSLTERQRFVLIQCVVNGRMQMDVAKELGTSRMNVTIILRYTLNKVRKIYGVKHNNFRQNHFYRPAE